MATLADLQASIIRDLARSDTSITDIVTFDIISAIREYESQRFYFNERSLSITLSATNTYALSLWVATDATLADIIEIDQMSVLINSGTRRYMLKPIGFNQIRDEIDTQPAQPTGNPTYYALWSQSIKLDSYPATAITGTIDCHVRLKELATGSDTNAWTNDAFELIRFAAQKRLQGVRFANPMAAQAAAEGERIHLAALRRKTDALTENVIRGYL